MVQDASQELLDAYENEDEMPDLEFSLVTPRNGIRIPPVRTWTDSDRNVILPCSGLVKATKACIKKTLHAISERGDGNDERSISELDGIAEIVKSSSALVDDFVLSLYPPVNHSAVRHQASLVRTNSKDLLTYVGNSHFFSEADATWIEFLRKAIDHNWVKINDMVLAD
ncbi:cyclin-D1-binding protein 1 homolog [Stegodyphus dumicola]|uniref:cyclin-D1-binding protein 1 homolog n=1 Tax=Stegodyphus dumicola TaxID=202533 RepID=UPI0015A8ACD6|nr:cyclin-D1-binding protein 1 homolog [Stegodyphus dumicola]